MPLVKVQIKQRRVYTLDNFLLSQSYFFYFSFSFCLNFSLCFAQIWGVGRPSFTPGSCAHVCSFCGEKQRDNKLLTAATMLSVNLYD